MSCSFDKILSDVKNLTQRLKNTDETTNKIIKDTSYFYVKLKSMNELQEKISMLFNSGTSPSKNDLSFDGNMENANLEKLRTENCELRELLKEYQTALELIMSRYRTDMNTFMHSNNLESSAAAQFHSNLEIDYSSQKNIELNLTKKYVDLYKIAVESTNNAKANVERLEKSIETLYSENEAMRKILGLIDHYFLEIEPISASSVRLEKSSNHLAASIDDHHHTKSSSSSSLDHLFDSSFSDDDRCSVSSDASVKTLI